VSECPSMNEKNGGRVSFATLSYFIVNLSLGE
jgi:hypothetical protein